MESRKQIKLDWSRVDRNLGDELFRPLPDTHIPTVRMAQEIERKMFTFMLLAGISKIYAWTETDVKDNIYSFTWRFDDVRPLNTQCTEHDFQNLVFCPRPASGQPRQMTIATSSEWKSRNALTILSMV